MVEVLDIELIIRHGIRIILYKTVDFQ